jgi:predicted Fe-Mo cluster-binding NifX family protein
MPTGKSAERTKRFGRAARFAVVRIEAVRALNIRSNEEVIEAQKQVDDDMLSALEEMVNAARAGKLEGRSALALAAIAW